MISSATAIYETIQIPRPPDLRRSSRNPVIDTGYQTHENVKKYYKTRTVDINNVYKIYKNIKYLKYRFTIILNMMIEKYGESFGSVMTKKITEEYLMIPQAKKGEYFTKEFYNRCFLYVESGTVPNPIQSPNPFRWHSMKHDIMKITYLKSLKITPDPRFIKYSAMELIPYLQQGYDIMSDGQEYILLSSLSV